jgi:hypothetical protein
MQNYRLVLILSTFGLRMVVQDAVAADEIRLQCSLGETHKVTGYSDENVQSTKTFRDVSGASATDGEGHSYRAEVSGGMSRVLLNF